MSLVPRLLPAAFVGGCLLAGGREPLVPRVSMSASPEARVVWHEMYGGEVRAGHSPVPPDCDGVTQGATAPLQAPVNLEASRDVKPNFRWLVPPVVRVCFGSELVEADVEGALHFWEERGLRHRSVVMARCAFDADGTPLDDDASRPAYGSITIARLGQLEMERKAGTAEWASCGDVPLWALVLLPPGPLDELALRHELGHAFGFPHVDRRGHVMNPRREAMGEDTYRLGLVGPS